MNSDPFVSVIIPTYNRADIVRKAIDSVLRQTYSNLEVIVVDDGSTDNTQSRLRFYGDRIRVLTQANCGPSVARNRGIAVARGEILAFLDSDDYWLPTKLARQLAVLNKAGPSVACCLCNCTIVYHDGTRRSTFEISDIVPSYPSALWLNPAEVLLTRFVIFNQAVAVRRRVLEKAGHFHEGLPFFCEDHELSLRLALQGPWAVIRDELVVCQDASPGSLGQQALRDTIRLRSDQLEVRNRITNLLAYNARYSALEKLSSRELRLAKYELFAARLDKLDSRFAAALAWCLRVRCRISRGLFRRSWLYPRMVLKPLS
jgi:glycosyltransferase involved in cell wall biosynthesis